MGEEAYIQLAEHLNAMPQGFPRTRSGVEIRLLKKIFSEEEARVAARMKLLPETPAQVAERLGLEPGTLAATLESMVSKGQILGTGPRDDRRYSAFPFVVGIHEFQLARIDREYAELFEAYFEESIQDESTQTRPGQVRVYPVEEAVQGDLVVLPFEKVSTLVDKAKAYAVADCLCRKEFHLLDKGCKATMNNCIGLSPDPHGFDIDYRGVRKVSKEEVLDLLRKAEAEGLVHTSWNVQDDHMYICNCCTCCCAVLRGVKMSNKPNFMAKSNYFAEIDGNECVSCGVCRDERCPVGAIDEGKDQFVVNRERCIGCGVCVNACPNEAIRLVRKPEGEIDIPPRNIVEWTLEKAQKTGRTLEGLI
jgi:Na+-translocating ferredoxin:NAD+ oxidoreductase subunit B